MQSGAGILGGAAGVAAAGATGLALALVGAGLPLLLALLIAAACAGLVVYAVARRRTQPSALEPDLVAALKDLEARNSALRHDLRGVLSPALMMSDRLLNNEDPKIRRAGEAVVKSIERATVLLSENKRDDRSTISASDGRAAGPPR